MHVVNVLLSSVNFSTSFKQARVPPLLDNISLNPSDVNDYRPIFLFLFLSKILEKVVFKQVPDFRSQNNLLEPKQSGFKSGNSTETAL